MGKWWYNYEQLCLTVFELPLDPLFALVAVVLLYLVVLTHDVVELARQRGVLQQRGHTH